MSFKIISLFLIIALGSMFAVVPTSSASVQGNPLKNISVTDTSGNLTNGKLSINRFAVQGGKIVALGTLTGTLNNQQINQAVTLPVTIGQHTCDILHLTLGPLHLDLLGLVVDLSAIELDITAQSGSGNLLGNLLCAIAKLLDGSNASLNAIATKLNQILRALG